jgi:hypothetical protein
VTDGKIDGDNDKRDEGGDVGRNPDAIQREIEQTRAELAGTIDAIADRLSPKRAASRGASAVKAQVSSVLGHGNGHAGAASVLDAAPSAAGKVDHEARHRHVRSIASSGGGAAYTGTTSYEVNRQLRVDRVLLAVGAAAALAGGFILWRSRR